MIERENKRKDDFILRSGLLSAPINRFNEAERQRVKRIMGNGFKSSEMARALARFSNLLAPG